MFSSSEKSAFESQFCHWSNAIGTVSLAGNATELEKRQKIPRSQPFSKHPSEHKKLHQKLMHLWILEMCSTYDYSVAWMQIRSLGKATLFHGNIEYEEWKAQAKPCTLIYMGKIGSGKSVLLASIVDDLYLCTRDQSTVVAYFFCQFDKPESLQARTIIGSLARELLRRVSNLTEMEQVANPNLQTLDSADVLKLLRQAFPAKWKAYFVLDGWMNAMLQREIRY